MTKRYVPPPTCEAFIKNTKRMQFLFGPVGGGKTTATIMKLMRLAYTQSPNSEGIRKTRFAVVRNTRPMLRDSVIKSVFDWFPPDNKGIKWHDTNMDLHFDFNLEDGTSVHSEWMFRPLDDEKDARRLLSVEYTGGWLSEFREIPFGLLGDLLSRTGRYPSMVEGGADWYGVIGESNMCTKGSEWYDFLMLDRPENVAVYIQPSGLSPEAENREFLKPDYYEMLLEGKSEQWVQAHVKSEFPESNEGKSVWGASFVPERHIAKDPIRINRNAPVIIGVDQGRSPAAVAVQVDHTGCVNVLDCTFGSGMGMDKFAAEYLRPMVYNKFAGMSILCVIDPAGCRKSEVNDLSPKDVIEDAGFKVIAAPSNAIQRRIDAVERQLVLANGMRFSPEVHELIQAVSSGYRYKSKRNGEFEETPEKKHPTSDLADALQYATMVAAGPVQGRVMRALRRGSMGHSIGMPPVSAWT